MSAPTPHDAYMQAASKIARIRTLMAELPGKLEEATRELHDAAEALGSDPLNLTAPVSRRMDATEAREVNERILAVLPGMVDHIAREAKVDRKTVMNRLNIMRGNGQVTRTGTPGGAGGGTGYVYHRAPAAKLVAESAA